MKILFVLVLLLFFSCCAGLRLSFKNESSENFKKMTAQLGKDKFDFENIKAGAKTKPIKVSGSYRYCPVIIITNKDTLRFRPTDYVGEKFYNSGRLQMKINIENYEDKRYIHIN